MSSIENLKEQAKRAKASKRALASLDESNPDNTLIEDTLFVLHKEECEVLEDLLYRGLEDKSLSSNSKRHILNIIKYLEV